MMNATMMQAVTDTRDTLVDGLLRPVAKTIPMRTVPATIPMPAMPTVMQLPVFPELRVLTAPMSACT